MSIQKIIEVANSRYPDGLVGRHFATNSRKEHDLLGDGLAEFIAAELTETHEKGATLADEFKTAAEAMLKAENEIQGVRLALEAAAKKAIPKPNMDDRDAFMVAATGCKVPPKPYDTYNFEGMSARDALTAVEKGWMDLTDCQNNSPDVESIINFLKLNPAFRAHGYVVSGKRDDTRISFEGVIAFKKPTPSQIKNYVEAFRHADEFDMDMPYRAWFY